MHVITVSFNSLLFDFFFFLRQGLATSPKADRKVASLLSARITSPR